MFVIYNTGYRTVLNLTVNNNKYAFKRGFVTKVDDEDAKKLLEMTSKDIEWCPATSKELKPFLELEDWCKGDARRYGIKTPYEPSDYLEKFSL